VVCSDGELEDLSGSNGIYLGSGQSFLFFNVKQLGFDEGEDLDL
jgi:hypothetical protein